MKICSKCKIAKDISEFYDSVKDKKQSWCIDCCRRYWQTRKENGVNQMRARQRRTDPRSSLLARAKDRAKKQGIPFSIIKEDIIVPECCPVLGIKLCVGDGSQNENSPSLDRLIPENGYVPGNIRVISLRANAIKNDATIEELRKVADWLEQQLLVEA